MANRKSKKKAQNSKPHLNANKTDINKVMDFVHDAMYYWAAQRVKAKETGDAEREALCVRSESAYNAVYSAILKIKAGEYIFDDPQKPATPFLKLIDDPGACERREAKVFKNG